MKFGTSYVDHPVHVLLITVMIYVLRNRCKYKHMAFPSYCNVDWNGAPSSVG